METPTTPEKSMALRKPKARIRRRRWLVILGIAICATPVGWQEAKRHYPTDSPVDFLSIEFAIGDLLSAASTDKMPRMVERDEFAAAVKDLPAAAAKFSSWAGDLDSDPLPKEFALMGYTPAYPTYSSAWDRFLRAFGRLHDPKNRLKAVVLFYAAAGWYPNLPTEDRDWRKLNQNIPWELTSGDSEQRTIYAISYAGTMAALAWLAIWLMGSAWNFLLARIRELAQAVRGV